MVAPPIWTLIDDRPGHRTQVEGLVGRLGLPYEGRRLSFNRLNRLPNPVLGASLLSLDRKESDPIEPPFPEMVISVGRRCVPIALWIRRASRGRSKLVHIGRKGVTAATEFDLLISCAHFNMPPHQRRMDVILPPTQATWSCLQKAKEDWPGLLPGPRPNVVLLIGGESALHAFPPWYAADLIRRAEAATRASGGTLTVVTSRRTPAEAIAAMQEAARCTDFHLWERHRDANPYLGFLAWADGLIVTGESESMLAEAVACQKPLFIAAMPKKPLSHLKRLKRRMAIKALDQDSAARLCSSIFNNGWITPHRDLEKLHDLLYAANLAQPFGGELSFVPPAEHHFLDQVNARLMNLLSPGLVPI